MKSLHLILLSFFFFSQCALFAQADKDFFRFPGDYYGDWQGPLHIYKGDSIIRTISMRLVIRQLNSKSDAWKIMYYAGEDTIIKAYELIRDDSIPGHFIIDEKNSILLDGYVHGGVFVQRYEVNESLITVRTERRGKKLYFEILAGSIKAIRKSGGIPFQKEKVPRVSSFKIGLRQLAILSKQP